MGKTKRFTPSLRFEPSKFSPIAAMRKAAFEKDRRVWAEERDEQESRRGPKAPPWDEDGPILQAETPPWDEKGN